VGKYSHGLLKYDTNIYLKVMRKNTNSLSIDCLLAITGNWDVLNIKQKC